MEVRQRGLIAGLLTAALLVAPLTAEANVPVAVKAMVCNVLLRLLNLINNLVKLRQHNRLQPLVLQLSKDLAQA